MAIQYNQLVQKPVDGNMTVFNTQTGQGYSNPDQLAGDLGVDKSAIDWKAIQTNPNWSYGGVANSNQQGVIGTRDSSVLPGTQEYYNTQTGQGFANPQELSNFVNQQGGQTNATNVFDNLKQGFSKLMATPAPASQGEANMAIQQVTPPSPIDTSNIEQALQADAGYQQLLKDYQAYNNTANQTASLLDTYKSLMNSSGLNAINTEMLNTKRIIEGTEDDIRNEVTAANGFATESQVLSLANARNKTLVKNYNALVDQANNIQNQVSTMMNFAGQDRQNALAIAQQKLNIDQQILQYRDKFISNAKEAFNNVINAVGYKGLYATLQNNPQSLALAEKTLGIAPGGLAKLAQTSETEWSDPYQMGGDWVQKNTKTGEIKNVVNVPSGGGGGSGTNKVTLTEMADAIRAGWNQEGYIQGNGKISSKDYREMKEAWKKEGFASSTFDSKFQDLIDKSGSNWKADYGYGT